MVFYYYILLLLLLLLFLLVKNLEKFLHICYLLKYNHAYILFLEQIKQVCRKTLKLKFSNKKIAYGEELQNFLNKFPGIYLKVDGVPGERTSDAFKKVTGYYLKDDLRK